MRGLLAVDAGNSATKLLFRGEDIVRTWRFSTKAPRLPDDIGVLLSGLLGHPAHVDGVAVSSVVPRVTDHLRTTVPRYLGCEPFVVAPGTSTTMPILVDDPGEVGPDRVTTAVAAFERFGGPALVIDMGTATTVDAVSAEGGFLGGAIVPGMRMSAAALASAVPGLAGAEAGEPHGVVGRSTAEAVGSGVLFGHASLVERIVERFRGELGRAVAVATGGLAGTVAPHVHGIDVVDPELIFRGLRILYERNAA